MDNDNDIVITDAVIIIIIMIIMIMIMIIVLMITTTILIKTTIVFIPANGIRVKRSDNEVTSPARFIEEYICISRIYS